jgi:2,4-dienoyl-CoA reductase-like NADH-dependent reductase (Old Yellow Enzyme family)
MHWGNLLNSGAGLFIIEATGVTPEGRITPACLGLWDDRTEAALKDKLTRARSLAPAIPVFIQLAHAGRKASSATPWTGGQLLSKEQGGWDMVAPSAIPQLKDERLPHELSKTELTELITAFVIAAQRSERIGIDGNNRLAKRIAHNLRQRAGKNIGAAAGVGRHHDAVRPIRKIALRHGG